jgi:hypothetical protein
MKMMMMMMMGSDEMARVVAFESAPSTASTLRSIDSMCSTKGQNDIVVVEDEIRLQDGVGMPT